MSIGHWVVWDSQSNLLILQESGKTVQEKAKPTQTDSEHVNDESLVQQDFQTIEQCLIHINHL